jgi:hypothetical protein
MVSAETVSRNCAEHPELRFSHDCPVTTMPRFVLSLRSRQGTPPFNWFFPQRPGNGLEWDEGAAAHFQVDQ